MNVINLETENAFAVRPGPKYVSLFHIRDGRLEENLLENLPGLGVHFLVKIVLPLPLPPYFPANQDFFKTSI